MERGKIREEQLPIARDFILLESCGNSRVSVVRRVPQFRQFLVQLRPGAVQRVVGAVAPALVPRERRRGRRGRSSCRGRGVHDRSVICGVILTSDKPSQYMLQKTNFLGSAPVVLFDRVNVPVLVRLKIKPK